MENLKTDSFFKAFTKICWSLGFITLALVGYSYIVGNNDALPWLTDTTYIKSPLFKEYFTIEGTPIGFSLDQVVNWQHYKTGQFRFLEVPQYLLFALIVIAYLTICVAITYLERFWFMVCAGILVFVSINLGLDEIGILDEYLAYIFIGLILVSSYYFQSFNPNISFKLRLLTFSLVFTAFWSIVFVLPDIQAAQFVIPSVGLLAPAILTGLFVFFIAGDNCFYLFKIATQNAPTGKNALIHFLAIGGIYILILVLLFLDLTGKLSLNLILIDPYTLLLVSMVSGYFVLKTKLEVVQSNIPFHIIKNLLYPVLAALTLSLIYFAEISANDSLISAIKMGLIIPHLAFGSVFYIYAFMNFTPDLLSNQPVWPLFFKGERAPLLTARVATVFFMVGVIYYLEFKPYYQLKAGQYNALGRYAEEDENDLLASQYYKQALFFDYASLTANYSLGMLEKSVGNASQVVKRLKDAQIRSTDFKAEMALSQYYSENNQLFNKLLSLKEIKNAANDIKVTNNLAIAHYEFNHLDTAFSLLSRSLDQEKSAVSLGNMLALSISFSESLNIDSVLNETSGDIDLSVKINRQALANATKVINPFNHELQKDSVLVLEELYYLFNAAIGPSQEDKNLLSAIEYYLPFERNITIKDYLLLAKAIQLYNFGLVNEAFFTLDELMAYDQRKAGLYSYIKSIWAYHQQSLNLAIRLLAQAEAFNFDRAVISDTYQAFLKQTIDNPTEQLNQQWLAYENLESNISSQDRIEVLSVIARQNAFDVENTLNAVASMRELGVSSESLYEILQKSIEVNPSSSRLYEQYIYETVESGLSMIGNSALEELSKFADSETFNRIRNNFLTKIENRAKEALNIN